MDNAALRNLSFILLLAVAPVSLLFQGWATVGLTAGLLALTMYYGHMAQKASQRLSKPLKLNPPKHIG